MSNCEQLLHGVVPQNFDAMEESIAAWEDEGGSPARSAQIVMTGTVNQIAWAEQIKIQVNGEFDRVRGALKSAASKQSAKDREDTETMIAILEEKRAEVMAREQAGYFIHGWQELRSQVRELIVGDSRYKAIKFRLQPRE